MCALSGLVRALGLALLLLFFIFIFVFAFFEISLLFVFCFLFIFFSLSCVSPSVHIPSGSLAARCLSALPGRAVSPCCGLLHSGAVSPLWALFLVCLARACLLLLLLASLLWRRAGLGAS